MKNITNFLFNPTYPDTESILEDSDLDMDTRMYLVALTKHEMDERTVPCKDCDNDDDSDESDLGHNNQDINENVQVNHN